VAVGGVVTLTCTVLQGNPIHSLDQTQTHWL